jgi:L,D-peptidoglycan transpeptidase YkuD (ErfK/YbiS/YcfS/YnhG family)
MSTRPTDRAPQLLVRRLGNHSQRGFVQLGSMLLPCALGRSGIRAIKREGDGATPRGQFALLDVFYNPDFARRPQTPLPLTPIARHDGWCDAPDDGNYNRRIRRPYRARSESLWRDDAVYDVVVVLNYNLRPRIRGQGSAIFMHVARPGLRPTEGCIALKREDLLKILTQVRRGSQIVTI